MRFPRECYQIQQQIRLQLPQLRTSQQGGLALWVYGTILAHCACQDAVIAALRFTGGWHAIRQYLRELLYDGADKAKPCGTELDVDSCFVPLLGWVLSWWRGEQLVLALDATLHKDRVAALVISVLYRGNAIPVAWRILPANQKGAWVPEFEDLLRLLKPAVPKSVSVLVLADRGLWSPRLWTQLRRQGWHPLMRLQAGISFQPAGERRQRARELVAGPGHAWVGQGTAFTANRRKGTLLVVWAEEQQEPWMLLTDLAPHQVGVGWYGLRIWIELGFRALKGVGWQWHKTRRSDPDRVARYWLVLAVATLWVLAYGTRVEDAERAGVHPSRMRLPPPPSPHPKPRHVSLFRLGLSYLHRGLLGRSLWHNLWLLPELLPTPPNLTIAYHHPP